MLDLLSNASNGVDEVTVAFTEYLGLLRGLVDAPQGGESKLRTTVMFKWTNSLGGRTPRCVCVEGAGGMRVRRTSMSAHALDIILIEDDVFMHSWEEERVPV